MNNRNVARWLIAIIAGVLIVCISLGLTACTHAPNNNMTQSTVPTETNAAVPDIPEGEPILTEDPTEPPTVMGTVNTDRLNVRNKPDIDDHVFRQMAVGTRVEILEKKETPDGITWGRIEDGWINLRYVTIDGEPEPTVRTTVDLKALRSLALVNYMEAGEDGCCNLCRRRICDVVLNRVADDRWANSIDGVLTEPYQFSYFWQDLDWPERANRMGEQHAIERAFIAAEQVLLGNHTDVYQKGYVWYQGINRTPDYIVCYDCGIWFSR